MNPTRQAMGLIGLLGAMEEEVQIIADNIALNGVERYLGLTFYLGTLSDHSVVVVHSGIGKVRAAACTQFLIDRFQVSQLIFVGIAGALRPSIFVGDIVISERATEWDFQAVSIERCWYQADSQLIASATEAAQRLGYRVLVGSVLTGDRPIFKPGEKHELSRMFNGDCVEMEGAAVAHVCSLNKVPFVLIRAVSDLADENAPQAIIQSFRQVSRLPAKVVLEMLNGL